MTLRPAYKYEPLDYPYIGPQLVLSEDGRITASRFVKVNEDTTLAMNTTFGTSLGAMPQFAQYRLGGMFGNGVRGFRSFWDLGTVSSLLMGTL